MVSLREKAIKAAKEHEERIKKSKQKAAEKFATRAKKEFEETFGEPLDVEPITVNGAKIIADGLTFIAKKERAEYAEYINFYPQVECSRCGKLFTYQYPCNNLVDVGMVLMKETVCNACREDIPPVTKSPAERVLELMTEILEILEAERSE